MNKTKHVLGLSGGKDSTALALYLNERHPELALEFYFCDTGKELDEVYETIEKLEVALGKKIEKLEAAPGSSEPTSFDHFLEIYGGFLPSSQARWCTKKLKLEPFEAFVGTDPTISYVGIRGDEEREGYISQKSNIQSFFPFRKNIWSQDVIRKVLHNGEQERIFALYQEVVGTQLGDRLVGTINSPISAAFPERLKLQQLLDADTRAFNHVAFRFLKQTGSPLPIVAEEDFPLLDNEDVLVKADIFKLLEDSGVGVPKYYQNRTFEVDGKVGTYARSRSGCYFCFFQQKIEWVWLLENHPKLYAKAQAYEKDGFAWNENETLAELAEPERVLNIKREFLKRSERQTASSGYLIDILSGEEEGCAACFI